MLFVDPNSAFVARRWDLTRANGCAGMSSRGPRASNSARSRLCRQGSGLGLVFMARLCQLLLQPPGFSVVLISHQYCLNVASLSRFELPNSCYIDSKRGHMYHALIRTHHITSRKKVARLKAAAKLHQCFALLRTGGIPGVMYVSGRTRPDVQSWVDTVHGLRYKDYQLAAPVGSVTQLEQIGSKSEGESPLGVLEEVATVKEMAASMESKGLINWWRVAMGFAQE